MTLTPEEKRKLVFRLFIRAILNWFWEGWRRPRKDGILHASMYVNFYHLPDAEGHHGTGAVVMKSNVRPEDFILWGTFGKANNVYVVFKNRKIYLYQMDWGIAKEEHFADSPELAALAASISSGEKIFLFGIRTLEGKLWWLYGPPSNFMLIPKKL